MDARAPHPHSAGWLLAAGASLLWLRPAAAEAPAPPAAAASASAAGEAAPTTTEDLLETTRRSVREGTEWLARGIDSWFGDRPFEQGGKVSDGRLDINTLHRQDTGSYANVRLNARLRLPNVERFGYLFIGRDDQRDVVTDTPDAFSRSQRLVNDRATEQTFLAGLGLTLHDTLDFRIGIRGGLKPYAQARYGQAWVLQDSNVLEARETVFWTPGDRLGSTTALSWGHAFTPALGVRWLTAATITQDAPKFSWSSNLGVYHDLGGQRLLSAEAVSIGTQGSGVAVTDYGVQLKWQQPIYKNWLLGEAVGGHFWPRPDPALPRGRAWALGYNLKMRF